MNEHCTKQIIEFYEKRSKANVDTMKLIGVIQDVQNWEMFNTLKTHSQDLQIQN